MDSIPRSIIIIILLVLCGGFFASSETSFSYCNKLRIKKLSEDGDKRAQRVNYVLTRFDKAISTILIGTNLCYVFANSIAALLFLNSFGSRGAVAAPLVMTVLIFIFAETIPKNIARRNCDRLVYIMAVPIRVFMIIFTPLSFIFSGLAKGMKALLPKPEAEPSITEDEFQTIIENIEEEGLIEHEESELIQSAIEFSDKRASEAMLPIRAMIALEIGTSADEVRELLLREKYSRIPIYAGTPDRVVGVLQTRECLARIMHGQECDLSAMMNLPYCVSPDTKLDALFEGFGRRRTHFAVVTGEDGLALGFITMEDVMEELVGEIYDEDDVVRLAPQAEVKK